MSDCFFITGTDTEVGKTYVSCLLCKHFIENGKKVGVFKPVESGLENNQFPDYQLLAKAANDVEKSLYTFKKPLAPLIASQIDNIPINFDKIINFIKNDFIKYDIYLIEGAGGLFVPLTENSMIIDLIKLTGFKVILVGRTNLGTVNHTLLSIEALKKRNIEINSIFLNEIVETPENQIKENIEMIENFGKVKVNGVIRKNSDKINFLYI